MSLVIFVLFGSPSYSNFPSLSLFQDGPTATKEIRALGYHGPIIGVTGNVLQFDVDHFLACGADRVVAKPLRKEGIESILEGTTDQLYAFVYRINTMMVVLYIWA